MEVNGQFRTLATLPPG